ncbi:MAG: LysM peptidoglycan-binding domain-containing protein [Acidimicrobiia bacterium]
MNQERRDRPTVLLRAAGALVLGVSVLVGLPYLLVTLVGNPFPDSAPSVDAMRQAIESGDIHSDVLFGLLGMIGWALWLQFAVAIGAESIAVVRGRPTLHLPASASMQAVVARMFAAVLLVSSAAPPRAAAAAPPPPIAVSASPTPVAPSLVAVPTIPASAIDRTAQDGAAIATGPAPRTYEVQPRDSLWSIAARELGDPLRWSEIADLNDGRVQPDGATFRSADLIQPGWVLLLPAIVAEEAAVPAPPGSDGASRLVDVARGDSLWTISEAQLGQGERWTELYELNRGRPQPDGHALRDPNVIEPGWRLTLPVAEADAPAPVPALDAASAPAPAPELTPNSVQQPLPVAAPSTAAAPEPSVSTVAEPMTAAEPAGASTVAPEPPRSAASQRAPSETISGTELASGGALLAGAVLLTLRRMRRRVMRRRLPGRLPAKPRETQAEAELMLRASEQPAAILRLRSALAGIALRRPDRARPIAWSVAADGVEVQLDGIDRNPAPGFVQGASGTQWRWVSNELRHDPVTAPACVGLGQADGADLFLDVEACGAISLTGHNADVQRLARACGLTLADSPIGGSVTLVVVGDASADGNCMSAVEALRLAQAHVASCRAALADMCVETTFAARCRADGDWGPLVVLSAEPLSAELGEAFVELAAEGGLGLAVIAPQLPGTPWEISVDARHVRVPRLQWAGEHAFAELVSAADAVLADTDSDLGDEPDGDSGTEEAASFIDLTDELAPVHVLPSDATPYEEMPFDVEVRILGDVEVAGTGIALDPRSTEFVAFLACQHDGVREERIKTALWPDSLPAASSWTNRVSKVRKGLGVDRKGELNLPHIAPGGRYALGDHVVSDLHRVRGRLEAARKQESAVSMQTLEDALDLVRGIPFGSARGYDWAFAHGLVADAEAVVVDAGHELAQRALASGDWARALKACERASRVAPASEILARDRMLAFDQAGDPTGVEAVMRDLCAVLESDDPDGDLHPETLALYSRLGRRRRPTA